MKQLNHTKDILMKENYLRVYLKDGNEKRILVSKIRSIYIKVNKNNKRSYYLLLRFFFILGLSVLFIQTDFSIIIVPMSILFFVDASFSQNKYALVVEYKSGINYNFPFSKKSKGEIVDELRNVRLALDGFKKNKENMILAVY